MKEMWPLNTRILRGGEKTGDKGDGQKKKKGRWAQALSLREGRGWCLGLSRYPSIRGRAMHCPLHSGAPKAPPSSLTLTSVGRGYPAHARPSSFPGESEILGRGLQSDLVQLPAAVWLLSPVRLL